MHSVFCCDFTVAYNMLWNFHNVQEKLWLSMLQGTCYKFMKHSARWFIIHNNALPYQFHNNHVYFIERVAVMFRTCEVVEGTATGWRV